MIPGNHIKIAEYSFCKASKYGKKVYLVDLPTAPSGTENKNADIFNKYKVQDKDYMDLDSFKRFAKDTYK